MDRKIPKVFIEVLVNWFGKLHSFVRWNEKISSSFTITLGVRQRGILSPILFAICVDDLLANLENSKTGCSLGSFCCNFLFFY